MNTHQIRLNDQPAEVQRIDHHTFNVNVDGRDIRLQYRQDNEGADHWIDLNSNHETEETKAIGEQLQELIKTE